MHVRVLSDGNVMLMLAAWRLAQTLVRFAEASKAFAAAKAIHGTLALALEISLCKAPHLPVQCAALRLVGMEATEERRAATSGARACS